MTNEQDFTLYEVLEKSLLERIIPGITSGTGVIVGGSCFCMGLGKGLAAGEWLMAIPYGIVAMVGILFFSVGGLFACNAYEHVEFLSRERGESLPKARGMLAALSGAPFLGISFGLASLLPG